MRCIKERNKHAEQMIKNGFKDSGQVKENVGTIMNPEFVWENGGEKCKKNLKNYIKNTDLIL